MAMLISLVLDSPRLYAAMKGGSQIHRDSPGLVRKGLQQKTVTEPHLLSGMTRDVFTPARNSGGSQQGKRYAASALPTWVQGQGLYGGDIYAFAMGTTGRIFAGTWGGGIFISTDNGSNWVVSNSGLGTKHVVSLAISPSGSVFAGSNGQGIYISTDNGVDWSASSSGLSNDYVMSLAINPAGDIFAGTLGGVDVSKDNGATWSSTSPGFMVYSLVIDSSGNIFAGTAGSGVYVSTDDGTTWTASNTGITNVQVWSLAIDSTGSIFAATDGTVYVSTDDGMTWATTGSGLPGDRIWSVQVNPSGYIFAGTAGSGIYVSTDKGNTWAASNNGLADVSIQSLAVNSSGYIFAGTLGGGVYLSTDGGGNWAFSDNNISGFVTSLVEDPSGHILAGTHGGLYVSTDNGTSWQAGSDSLANINIQSLVTGPSGHIFAGTFNRGVFVSTDNGGTWASANNGLTDSDVHAFLVASSGQVFAGTNGGVFISTDDGGTWTAANNGLTQTQVWSLAVDSSGDIIAGTSGGAFVSTDDGGSWSAAGSGLPVTWSLLVDPSGNIFAATDGGLYISTDDGGTWTAANSSLPSSDVLSLAMDLDGDIYAGTFAGGAFVSTNGGGTWSSVNNSMPGNSEVNVLMISLSGYIYAGTGGGAYCSNGPITASYPPALAGPADGSSGEPLNCTLAWSAYNGITSYALQVSIDPNFGSFVINQTGISGTSYQLSGLSNNTTYYWRVNAVNSAGTSSWSSVWSFTTSGGSQTFWTPTGGPPGGNINALVTDKLNGYVYAATDNGVYYSSNNGSSWTSTGSSAGSVRALAVGLNGYLYEGVTAGVYRSTNGGASWYLTNLTSNTLSLTVSQSGEIFAGTFSSGIMISTDYGNSWSARGLSSDEIYAIAVDSSGNIFAGVQNATNTNYAGVYRSTDGANSWTQVGLMGDELWALAIDSSGDIIAGTGQNGTFISTDDGNNWTQSNSGLTNTMIYSLTVSSTGNIFAGSDGSGVFESMDRGNSWNATGPTNHTYWSLCATTSGYVFAGADSGGVYRAGAGTSTSPPSPPNLLAPVNGATGTATGLRLSWEASSGATSYRLQVSTDLSFATTEYDVSGLAAVSDSITGFNTQTTYYWRVDATNSAGTSAWSSVWDFTPGAQATAPPSPVLSAPANGETGASTSLSLTWQSSAGADSYGLQVSTDASFSTTVYNLSGLHTLSDSIAVPSTQTTYYWHVDATNSIGTSAWSSTWSFTTGSGTTGAPSAPALISPANNSSGTSTQLRFSWGPSVGATSYEFQISTDASFSTIVNDVSGLTVNTDSVYTGLNPQTIYYWRVDASDSAGTSPWSAVWQFTTGNSGSSLSPPTLSGPADGTNDVWIDPVLSWNGSSGATGYEVQVSTDPSFNSVVTDMPGLVNTSVKITDLSYGTTYYWRVNAINSTDVSSWSADYSFTTLTYPSSVQVSFESSQYLPTNDLSVSGYRMIGFPGNVDIPISNVISGKQDYDWDAYYDNGADQSYFVEYDGSSQFAFQPGNAFWILSRDSFAVNQTVSPVQLDTSGCYSIGVHNGWNMISDPFEKSIDWSAVQSLNGTSQPVFAYNGSFQQSTVLDPYYGYYFYNNAGISDLRIPYANASSVSAARRVQGANGKTLTATLLDGSRYWSSITVGASTPQKGQDGKIFAPPGNFEQAGMCVIDSSIRSGWNELVQDVRDTIGAGQEFDFTTTNRTGRALTLKFSAEAGLNGYEIYLVDKDLSRSYNLRDTDEVPIPSFNKLKNYSILIGDRSFVDAKMSELIPRKFVLYQNYPNPFNPTTVIRFEVPTAGHVNLTVYDVLGRKVETLMDANVASGYYEVPFDGSRFASGVYFYRISTGTFTRAMKMLLLK